MPLLTDEPLIDDSELDEFDWHAYESQPITCGGYTVRLFHEVMQTTYLVASAVLFKSASWVLGLAVRHTDKINTRKRRRMFGVHQPASYPTPRSWSGVLALDEYPEPDIEAHRAMFTALTGQHPGVGKTQWTEAEPCSDFDPIHPDYIDPSPTTYSEK